MHVVRPTWKSGTISPNSLPTLRMHSRTGFKRSGDITKPVVAGNERAYLVRIDDNVISDAGLYDRRLRSDLGGGHWQC